MKRTRDLIRTLSLFSGAGGLDIGFRRAGFDILGCVEINEAYCSTLRANAGSGVLVREAEAVFCQDVREFAETGVKVFLDQGVECVIGGPPCQTFSAAGRRSGGVLGTSDERGKLFESYCKILAQLRPRVFVFENVYGLPGANDGKPWREIVRAFSSLGYSLRAEVLDSADYGVPQHRERLVMVGYLDGDYTFPLPTHGPDSPSGVPFVSSLAAIADLQDPAEPYHAGLGGRYGHLLPLVPEGLNYSFFTAEMGHPEPVFAWRSKFHDLLYKVDPRAPCRTIKAQPGKFTGPFHWKNRHFTIPELKRLQSFPDDYVLVGSFNKVIEQIGNSVPPHLAEVIAVSVREQLFEQRSGRTYRVRPPGFRSTFRQRQRERSHEFKRKAMVEINRRYGDLDKSNFAAASKEVYYVKHLDYFDMEIRVVDRQNGRPPKGYSRVEVLDSGTELVLALSNRAREAELNVTVSITGLNKYLGRIGSLEAAAALDSTSGMFELWAAVERALVSKSQFFTLIDIYGHYANRGDVVKISTEISRTSCDPLTAALAFFGQTENCGATLSICDFAEGVGCQPQGALELVEELRRLRYDVRTAITHPTLKPGLVLCTYPFPLLSERAHVRRRVSTVIQEAIQFSA
jgi:DNA (cytosine-5)-methyltransferase 1